MIFNQTQIVEGEIQKDEITIGYKIVWVRDVPRDTVQIDEIDEVWVLDSDNEEIKGYYDEHRNEIESLVLEDAYKHEPTEWEQPSWRDWQEAMAEEKM